MGTDIHLYGEVKTLTGWKPLHEPSVNKWGETGYPRLYDNRNYNVFAMLADVRNGRGFAGAYTGEGYNPISEPRGLPEDLSDEYRKADRKAALDTSDYDLLWFGDHSFSWLTLQELYDYDWAQETVNSGVCSVAEYLKWLAYDEKYSLYTGPSSYSGGISGPGIVTLSREDMDARIAQVRARIAGENPELKNGWELDNAVRKAAGPANRPFLLDVEVRDLIAPEFQRAYVQLHWKVLYAKEARDFYAVTMPQLRREARERDVELSDIRVVFGFDS